MPLASADPFGGVVITDWYINPEKVDERVQGDRLHSGHPTKGRRPERDRLSNRPVTPPAAGSMRRSPARRKSISKTPFSRAPVSSGCRISTARDNPALFLDGAAP